METFVLNANDKGRATVAANLHRFLDRLPADKSWRVEVKRESARRSDAQNRYLWGVAYAQLAKATGQPAEDWHEYFLGEHWETVEMLGRRKLRPVRRSSRLTKSEFAQHVEFIQARAAEHGIYIPDPNEG